MTKSFQNQFRALNTVMQQHHKIPNIKGSCQNSIHISKSYCKIISECEKLHKRKDMQTEAISSYKTADSGMFGL